MDYNAQTTTRDSIDTRTESFLDKVIFFVSLEKQVFLNV